MERLEICVCPGDHAAFKNHSAYCVGTGRMGLALQKEYLDQLAMAQAEAGFTHIRGHGLFCDDMGIYQSYTDESGITHEEYNFVYLDRVMDSYRALGLRPFLELGFMPEKMASGKQTIFYWKGNVTPPKDDAAWQRLVKATLEHLAQRYGREEVSTWPCEVWNEPNLPGFWENADKDKYLHLYEITTKAVKEVMPDMKVGGPAICGGSDSQEWIRDFLSYCTQRQIPVDFVTRHAYMGNTPEHKGRYLYHEMRPVEALMDEMNTTRKIIDSFPEYKGIPMHITEFNTSYHPFCPIHDTNLNAAYIAALLSRLGDVADSYSYWTFGDVFEEQGVPARPFHGGFGMIANGLIAKPTLWTFAFYNKLNGSAVYRDDHAVIVKRDDGAYEGILWNLCRDNHESVEMTISLPACVTMALLIQRVDEACCNPLKAWHDMGEPASLDNTQLRFLRQAAQPRGESDIVSSDGNAATFTTLLGENAVLHFTLSPRRCETEYGYDYQWYRQHQ